jgi:YVTN family beta-propeller protein
MPQPIRFLLLGLCLLICPWLLPGQASAPPRQPEPAGKGLQRPIALILSDAGTRLLVANRDSGCLTTVDTRSLKVVSEKRIGRKLSGMAATPNRDLLLIADEEAGEVVLLAQKEGSLRELRRLHVGLSPVSVQLSEEDGLAVVTCLWPRRLVLLDLAALKKPDPQDVTVAVLDLPFAPRCQLLVPGRSKLLVADSFGSQLAVVDLRRRTIEAVRSLAAVHNIRDLVLDRHRKNVWLTNQLLHSQGRPTPSDIRSGNLLANEVRRLSLAAVLDPRAELLQNDQVYALGDIERGAGDPAAVAELDDGTMLVTLAGINELAIGHPEKALWTRLAVGRRPTALAVDTTRRRAYVANTFADSISVIDWHVPRVIAEVRLGAAPRELQPSQRGELLFFDARLSLDGWYSCHSCHTDGHTNGRLNDNFTDGSFGTPKRVLSLLGVKDTGPWAWNGKMPDLETQIRTSVRGTMQGPVPSADQVRDLTAFLQTLSPPPGLRKARGSIDAESRKRGQKVFSRQKCASCHPAPTYTSPKTYDVGLRDEVGGSHFNPPSLRGISQAGPYFHDNRARTLEEVFTRFNHELSAQLTDQELRDLLYFLGSL